MVVGRVSSGASLEVGWCAGGVARLVCYTGCGTKLDLTSWRGSMKKSGWLTGLDSGERDGKSANLPG